MKRLLLAAALIAAPALAQAESLRCSRGIASEGDSRISVAYKCGEPMLKDRYCAPVYHRGSYDPVPEPWAGWAVPCRPVDEWLYDRGPGNLMATVRFRDGVVWTIQYGHVPR